MSRFYPNSNGTLTPKVSTWKPKLSLLTNKSNIGTDANGDLIDRSDILYYDATIGTGGDYPILNNAYAAGKFKLKAIGNVTINNDITLTNNSYINLGNYTLNFSTYNITSATYTLQIVGAISSTIISFAYSSAKTLFTGFTAYSLNVNGVVINNNSNAIGCAICGDTGGTFMNITANIPNYQNCGFGISNFIGIVERSVIHGGGSSCLYALRATEISYKDLTFTGQFNSNGAVIVSRLDNAIITVTGTFTVALSSYISTIRKSSGTISVQSVRCFNCDIDSFSSQTGGTERILELCDIKTNLTVSSSETSSLRIFNSKSLNITTSVNNSELNNIKISGNLIINANSCTVSNCIITGTITINGDYNKFSNNQCTGAVTLSSGSEYNVITGNTFTGGFTDNSGVLNNEINNNI